jgi:hypothetical protein
MTIYSKLALLGLAVTALASVEAPAAANPNTDQMRLSSGALTVSVTDNDGVSDINPLIGTVAYANANFNGWVINFTAGTSHSPNLSPFGLDLTSLTANCIGGPCSTDPLIIAFSDIDFAVPINAGGFSTTYSGTITGGGTTTESAYFDNSNTIFGTADLIGTVGPLGAPFGGGIATGGTVAATPNYSLTLVQTFTDTNGGPVSFSVDGNITAVPEPGTLAIFGTALGSLALIRRRKRS